MPPPGVKAGGGRMDFCWLVFDQVGEIVPSLDWLHRDA
jgi:hypothetical protein